MKTWTWAINSQRFFSKLWCLTYFHNFDLNNLKLFTIQNVLPLYLDTMSNLYCVYYYRPFTGLPGSYSSLGQWFRLSTWYWSWGRSLPQCSWRYEKQITNLPTLGKECIVHPSIHFLHWSVYIVIISQAFVHIQCSSSNSSHCSVALNPH